ncbi:hypothetical protein PanWU01x14_134250 [Parasponia andersonii]|uniref:Uncharacterized protein n=1 Tax=Parasponia andersonii TaxID=3476 RepID=A0A2P5CPL4_PARAD|nr:hypothetical protein PanWU01x14_134250 [Parasponia andersonii]
MASRIWASTKWPMRALAMTGMVTACLISLMSWGSLIRATPPWARMSAGTRSRAMTAHAPASSAIRACSAFTTSMMTPPRSIWARPTFTENGDFLAVSYMAPFPYTVTTPVSAIRMKKKEVETNPKDGG